MDAHTADKSKKNSFRQDSCYIGTENIECKPERKEAFIEVALFFAIAIICLVLFFTHIDSIKGDFRVGKLSSVRGIFIVLILSPFGAHLTARVITYLWQRFKLR